MGASDEFWFRCGGKTKRLASQKTFIPSSYVAVAHQKVRADDRGTAGRKRNECTLVKFAIPNFLVLIREAERMTSIFPPTYSPTLTRTYLFHILGGTAASGLEVVWCGVWRCSHCSTRKAEGGRVTGVCVMTDFRVSC